MDSPASLSTTSSTSPPTVSLMGLRLARLDRYALLDRLFASLQAGRGGWLVTANMDFLRRYVRESTMRQLYDTADLRVADGTPVLWACRAQGDRLPGRVPGSSLIWLLAERAAREGRSLYLLGGTATANQRAAEVLAEKHPGVRIAGAWSPRIADPPSDDDVEQVSAELTRTQPDILLVGLGSPKQEQLIRALRPRFPAVWMVGVGITFSFVAGEIRRAPSWMRKSGTEWLHRLAQEPRRLAKRYLLHDLPFAVRLFGHAFVTRLHRATRRSRRR
jgi:N-acetylglucosaminyldiphosphoundecaprenol N-acetyl-beta-D-mannosaminyltransferase